MQVLFSHETKLKSARLVNNLKPVSKASKLSFIYVILLLNTLFILVPGEPQDFKVIKVTSNSIELEWKAPKREDQSTATTNIKGYEIHYFKVILASSSSNTKANIGATSLTSETQVFKRKTNDLKRLKYVLTNLESNSLYKIQIFAYNMKGDGQRSSPLLVNTLDEGPNKPENIRSEIYNDLLQIKWQAPSVSPSNAADSGSTQSMSSWVVSAKTKQTVGGYRVFFNNEKYELDALTTQITFQRPKWGKLK